MSPEERKEYDAVVASYPGLPDPCHTRVPDCLRSGQAAGTLAAAAGTRGTGGRWRAHDRGQSGDAGHFCRKAGGLSRPTLAPSSRRSMWAPASWAAPVSYEIDSQQYIAVLAGFGGAMAPLYPSESAPYRYQNYGRLLTFKLGGTDTPLPPPRQPAQTPPPPQLPHCYTGNGAARRGTVSSATALLPRRPGRDAPVGVPGPVSPERADAWRVRTDRARRPFWLATAWQASAMC